MKIRRLLLVIYLVIVVIVVSVVLAGCAKQEEKTKPKQTKTNKSSTTSTGSNKIGVLMLGRSVMGGWFRYWTGDSGQPYTHGSFRLYPAEVSSPPDIVSSAQDKINENSDKIKIVFFKFCFEDFTGGSREEARDNLARNKGYISEIYQTAVKDKGFKLILGNALPQVKNYTNDDLVWSQTEFNKYLNSFASEHPGEVYVFDQYSILADNDGSLKGEYTTDPEDSHPNDQGYAAMDTPFFTLLESIKL